MSRSGAKLVLLFSLWQTTTLTACPCGCSSSATESNNGPLQLQADEKWRLQTGLSRESLGERINAFGEKRQNLGPEARENLRFGLARAVNTDLSVSGQFVIKRNWHPAVGGDTAVGDPSLAARYRLYDPYSYSISWPAIAVYASYKQALAKSALDASTRAYDLDVHGAGASEFAPGVDCEFRHGPWSLTLAESLHFRRPVSTLSEDRVYHELQIGWADRANLTASYSFWGKGQILASFVREAKRQDAVDGQVTANSDAVKHTLGVGGNLKVGQKKTLSLGFLQTGSLLEARNTQDSMVWDLGYTQAI